MQEIEDPGNRIPDPVERGHDRVVPQPHRRVPDRGQCRPERIERGHDDAVPHCGDHRADPVERGHHGVVPQPHHHIDKDLHASAPEIEDREDNRVPHERDHGTDRIESGFDCVVPEPQNHIDQCLDADLPQLEDHLYGEPPHLDHELDRVKGRLDYGVPEPHYDVTDKLHGRHEEIENDLYDFPRDRDPDLDPFPCGLDCVLPQPHRLLANPPEKLHELLEDRLKETLPRRRRCSLDPLPCGLHDVPECLRIAVREDDHADQCADRESDSDERVQRHNRVQDPRRRRPQSRRRDRDPNEIDQPAGRDRLLLNVEQDHRAHHNTESDREIRQQLLVLRDERDRPAHHVHKRVLQPTLKGLEGRARTLREGVTHLCDGTLEVPHDSARIGQTREEPGDLRLIEILERSAEQCRRRRRLLCRILDPEQTVHDLIERAASSLPTREQLVRHIRTGQTQPGKCFLRSGISEVRRADPELLHRVAYFVHPDRALIRRVHDQSHRVLTRETHRVQIRRVLIDNRDQLVAHLRRDTLHRGTE